MIAEQAPHLHANAIASMEHSSQPLWPFGRPALSGSGSPNSNSNSNNNNKRKNKNKTSQQQRSTEDGQVHPSAATTAGGREGGQIPAMLDTSIAVWDDRNPAMTSSAPGGGVKGYAFRKQQEGQQQQQHQPSETHIATGTQNIPLPDRDMRRIESELRLRHSMAMAEQNDLNMFYRLVNGIRERQLVLAQQNHEEEQSSPSTTTTHRASSRTHGYLHDQSIAGIIETRNAPLRRRSSGMSSVLPPSPAHATPHAVPPQIIQPIVQQPHRRHQPLAQQLREYHMITDPSSGPTPSFLPQLGEHQSSSTPSDDWSVSGFATELSPPHKSPDRPYQQLHHQQHQHQLQQQHYRSHHQYSLREQPAFANVNGIMPAPDTYGFAPSAQHAAYQDNAGSSGGFNDRSPSLRPTPHYDGDDEIFELDL